MLTKIASDTSEIMGGHLHSRENVWGIYVARSGQLGGRHSGYSKITAIYPCRRFVDEPELLHKNDLSFTIAQPISLQNVH